MIPDFKNKLRKLARQIFPKKRIVRIVKLRKEASSREYYRIFAGSRHTMIAMVINDLQTDPQLITKIFDSTEVFRAYKICVPAVYRFFKDDNIILEQDAGSVSLENFVQKSGRKKIIPFYKQIIDCLLKIHYEEIPEGMQEKTPFVLRFTKEKFLEEFFFFLRYSGLKETLEPSRLKILEQVFEEVSVALTKEKYVLTHRDLHSRNIQIKKSSPAFLDHQDARLGPQCYDLVSLIKDSYVNLNHKIETELIAYFLHAALLKYNAAIDEKTFFRSYYLTVFQRSVKAAGTFYYQSAVKNNLKYKQYIPIVLKYALIASSKLEFQNKTQQVIEEEINKLIHTSMIIRRAGDKQ